jgi:hypothetical protein
MEVTENELLTIGSQLKSTSLQQVEENLSVAGGASGPVPGGGFFRNRAQIHSPTGTKIVT